MSNFASSKPIILTRVRATWLDIFKPGEGMNGGEPKYKVSALIEPGSNNATLAKTAMLEAAKALWGANAENVVRSMAANNKAVRNGNDKLNDDGTIRDEYKDMLYISTSNKSKPQVVAPKRHNGQFVTITEDGRGMISGLDVTNEVGYQITPPYRGCYINLKVTFVAGKSFKGSNGEIIPNQVYAKVEAVQFAADGEAFGAGPTSAEGFGDEEVSGETESAGSLF
jgi:dUTPase